MMRQLIFDIVLRDDCVLYTIPYTSACSVPILTFIPFLFREIDMLCHSFYPVVTPLALISDLSDLNVGYPSFHRINR